MRAWHRFNAKLSLCVEGGVFEEKWSVIGFELLVSDKSFQEQRQSQRD